MLKAARQAADAKAAVAAQTAALRREFGWEREQRKRIFTARRPVALTVWETVKPPPEDGEAPPAAPSPDIIGALAEFERWYEVEFGTNYLAILDQEMEELPVVEF